MLSILGLALLFTSTVSATQCKVVPGDTKWPTSSQWKALSNAVGGRLQSVVPPAAACHNSFEGKPTYNASACSDLLERWSVDQALHYQSPTSVYWDFWTNGTCALTTNPDTPCTIGTYPRYVVAAKGVKDVQAAVRFAREKGVRLLIKNTGHDFNGKSIGANSLSIWTHQLKDVKIFESYADPSTSYTGSAVRLGAGWQGGEIYELLAKSGKTIVGGECATVGFAGGYIQGGGHGPLSGILGMASDHVLQYTVVTADGRHRIVDAANNADLFWALRGGGGGTFGVVTSVTVKTHDTPPVSTLTLDFTNGATNASAFWAGLTAFHGHTPAWAARGIYVYYEFSGAPSLTIRPLLAPHLSAAQLTSVVAPFLRDLDAAGVTYTHNITAWPTWLHAYRETFTTEGAGINMLTSSRLIQAQHLTPANNAALGDVFRGIAEDGKVVIGHAFTPRTANNAINPIWKDGVLLPLYNYFWTGNETQEQQWEAVDQMAGWDAKFKALTPGSGTYVSEANAYEPDWQHDFYGQSWARLSAVKKKVDPEGVFWSRQAVGSEKWVETEGGRLCRV
ncbi:FAD binding domain-containing protein [Geopyxis carbonaria]|nr:FAD binding domain-containing protein [Geopyxis carbonaria]